MKKTCVIMFVLFLFSCRNKVQECYHTEYYPEGNIKAVECFNSELQLRNRREYFKNGKLAMSFFVNDQNELEGPYRAYHENGNLKTKSQLVNGLIEGIQYDYHKTGEIEAITHYKKNRVNGYQRFYNADGALRTEFYKFENKLIYEKRILLDTVNSVYNSIENFFPIVSTVPKVVSLNDTIVVTFSLPLPTYTFDLNNIVVNFTCIPDIGLNSEKRAIDPDWLIKVPLINKVAESKVIVQDTGRLEIVGFLSKKLDGKNHDYDFFHYQIISENQ